MSSNNTNGGGPKSNIGPVRDQWLSTIIILGAFGVSALLSGALLLIAYFAIGNTDVSIQRARDILLVVVPVQTLVIGSAFGFIAGQKTVGSGARREGERQ